MNLRDIKRGIKVPQKYNFEQEFLDKGYTASSRVTDKMVQIGLGEYEDYIPVPEMIDLKEKSSEVANEINLEISSRLEELVEVMDENTEYLSTKGGMRQNDGDIVKPWNDLYNHYIARTAKITGDDYANLPQSTKDVLQIMNRSKQIRHMQSGSTVYDHFGSLLSDSETVAYIEDFCSAFEKSLKANGINLELERPKGVGAINSLQGVVYSAVDALHLSDNSNNHAAIVTALRQTVKPFIETPRQRLSAFIAGGPDDKTKE